MEDASMTTIKVSKQKVADHLQKLAKVRLPEDRPTEKEVLEMILRMK
jgi:hypothetical protein